MKKTVLSKRSTSLSLLCLAVILGGCGESGSDARTDAAHGHNGDITTHATGITKAIFVKKADAICLAARERSSEEFQIYLTKNQVPSAGPGMLAKAHDVVNTILAPALELQVKKISNLGAPATDVAQVNEILVAMEQGVERMKEQPLQFIQKGIALNRASKLAGAYGLTVCSNGAAKSS
jgi:hypothetical protein